MFYLKILLFWMTSLNLSAESQLAKQACEVLPNELFRIKLKHDGFVWAGETIQVKLELDLFPGQSIPLSWSRAFLTLTAEASSGSRANIAYELIDLDLSSLGENKLAKTISLKIPTTASGPYQITSRFVSFLGETSLTCVQVLDLEEANEFHVRNRALVPDQEPPKLLFLSSQLSKTGGEILLKAEDSGSSLCTVPFEKESECAWNHKVSVSNGKGQILDSIRYNVTETAPSTFKITFVLPYQINPDNPNTRLRFLSFADRWGNLGTLQWP